jgi:hypothetical protein
VSNPNRTMKRPAGVPTWPGRCRGAKSEARRSRSDLADDGIGFGSPGDWPLAGPGDQVDGKRGRETGCVPVSFPMKRMSDEWIGTPGTVAVPAPGALLDRTPDKALPNHARLAMLGSSCCFKLHLILMLPCATRPRRRPDTRRGPLSRAAGPRRGHRAPRPGQRDCAGSGGRRCPDRRYRTGRDA